MKLNHLFTLMIVCLFASCGSLHKDNTLSSPNGQLQINFSENEGKLLYAVDFNGKTIIKNSALGLKKDKAQSLHITNVLHASNSTPWTSAWGIKKEHLDSYNEMQLHVDGSSEQTIVFRAYDDGIAFRYVLPEGCSLKNEAYLYEQSRVSFISEKPTAWIPISSTMVSDAIDIDTWKAAPKGQKKVNKNTRYSFKPSHIKTPMTVKLSDEAYISLHEAEVTATADGRVSLNEHSISYIGNYKKSDASATPWRTVTIADRPGGLIESTLIVNLNAPSKIKDVSWIKPGKTMWDWRNHGALADDGFEYGITTESYIRYIDFAAENNVEYVMVDAEWYGHERSKDADPKTYLPQIDIPQICAHAQSKGVGVWLYINTIGLEHYDIDETFRMLNKWGVVGIKQGFLNGDSGDHIQRAHKVVEKCAEYKLMYVLHEPHKPSGYRRTYPNILAYEYVNSMLDGPSRPSATPSRLINLLFVHGLSGPVDRSCGMFDLDNFIARDKCHRQLPSTVVSQAAQCLLFPSGLLTLPDHPDSYKRKSDLFEFIAQLPMNWDETKVFSSEIGQYITLGRRSEDEWFVASLADEAGRELSLDLDFLAEGVQYDITLYEDAEGANYKFEGPGNKAEAKLMKQEMVAHTTHREEYTLSHRKVKKGDTVDFTIAPGGGHCMWIRPVE